MNAVPKTPPFSDIAQAYYRAWFRYHPEAAVDVGVPGYSEQLTPYAPDAVGALVCLNDELVVSLDELDRSALTADEDIDFQIMRAAALLENQRILELDVRSPDPGRYLPINAIYQLTIRPVPDFAAALRARLSAIPGYLDGARAPLRAWAKRVPPLWLNSTIVGAREGATFMRGLDAHPQLANFDGPDLDALRERAAHALDAYADFLQRDIAPDATGDFACGRAYFESMLAHRHFLDVSADQLHDFGQALFDQTARELVDACRDFAGHSDIGAALTAIQRDHPSAEKLLAAYQEQMRAARAFVVDRGLVCVPNPECLDVVATPIFLRHQIPFAAYSEPAPNDCEQRGRYYVTPADDAGQLAQHDYAGLMHTCVHEAWPGHHLQFVTANLNAAARALPRLLNPSATLYEGWALYCEQLMLEQGFLHRPEARFLLLRDRLWRALRVIIDVGLHVRGLSLDAAADLMVRHLGFPRAHALADLTWYTRAPTVPLSYATGWALINGLRAETPDLALKDFHDRLLSAGSIGLPQVIRRAFGEEPWARARKRVFGGDAT